MRNMKMVIFIKAIFSKEKLKEEVFFIGETEKLMKVNFTKDLKRGLALGKAQWVAQRMLESGNDLNQMAMEFLFLIQTLQ